CVHTGCAQILRRVADFLRRVRYKEAGRRQTEWAPARLRREDIFQVTFLENRRGNTGGDPHELLDLIYPRRDRDALRGREEAEQDIDLLLLDQAHNFIDGDFGLALRIRIDRLDLIALNPALSIEIVDHHL